MKTIILYTEKAEFRKELEVLAVLGQAQEAWAGEKAYCCCFKSGDTAQLLSLLERLVLVNNSAIQVTDEIHKAVRQLVFRKHEGAMEQALAEYVRRNQFMNLEGYIAFRLREVCFAVNEMLYLAIKSIIF